MSRIISTAVMSAFLFGCTALAARAQDAAQPAGGQEITGPPGVVKIITLKHASAEDMQRIVGELFPRLDSRQAAFFRSGNNPQGMAIRTSFDPRTNSLIIFGAEQDAVVIEALLVRLDVPTPKEGQAAGEKNDISQARKSVDRPEQRDERPNRSGSVSPPPPSPSKAVSPGAGTRLHVEAGSLEGTPLKVLSVVEPGKHVKKGELVLALDMTPLEDAIRAQQIEVNRARAALQQSEALLTNLMLQQETKIAEVDWQLELAKLNLAEYREGTLRLQMRVHHNEIVQAERELEELKRLEEAGRADAKLLERVAGELELAKLRLYVYEKFTAPKTLKELESSIASAESNAQRVRKSMAADVKAAQAELASKRAQVELAVDELDSLQSRLAKGNITAPHDGIVASAGPLPLREGSQVRQGQAVLIVVPEGDS